jgi:hypothetical protein
MRRYSLTFWFMLLVVLTTGPANSAEKQVRLGQVMWSAFECFTYALASEKPEEADRLFVVGLKAGRDFMDAVKSGNVSKEELFSDVPSGVSDRLAEGGPSNDFIIGRMYEAANAWAIKTLSESKASLDKEVRTMIAEDTYGKRNCALIK